MAALWMALGACTPSREGAATPILEGTVVRAPVPPPAALSDPLDIGPAGTPVGRVQHLLCARAPGAREALVEALATYPDWVHDEGVVEDACATSEWFTWVREALIAADGAPSSPLWAALLDDADPATGALVVREAPAGVALAYVYRHQGPYDPRLKAIVHRWMDADDGSYAIGALAAVADPLAERALLELAAVAHGPSRDEIALALVEPLTVDGRALHDEVCRRRGAEDYRCTLTPPLDDLASAVTMNDADAILARYPAYRAAVVDALVACTRDEEAPARRCARALLDADGEAARKALSATTGPELADLRHLAALGPEGTASGLRALGFEVPPEAAQTSVGAMLVAAGAAEIVHLGTRWPPHNDRFLAELAALAGGEPVPLFLEVLPSPDAVGRPGRTPSIALYGWSGGWRYRTRAEMAANVDVDAGVRLVNAVLEARGATKRLAADVDRTFVVAASPEVLTALGQDAWLRFAEGAPSDGDEGP